MAFNMNPFWIFSTVHPYIVKENLQRKEKQPKEFKKIKWFERDEFDPEENMRGMVREEALSRICNKVLRGNWTDHYKCHFLHHFDPFLKLGPFKLEIKLDLPYRAVLHDILNDEEIQHMIDLSKVSILILRAKSFRFFQKYHLQIIFP